MFSPEEENQAFLLCCRPQRRARPGQRPLPFQTRSPGPQRWGSQLQPGRARGGGEGDAHLTSLVPQEQKQPPNQKEREPQSLPPAANQESHFGKYLSKTKPKQKPNTMVVEHRRAHGHCTRQRPDGERLDTRYRLIKQNIWKVCHGPVPLGWADCTSCLHGTDKAGPPVSAPHPTPHYQISRFFRQANTPSNTRPGWVV